MATDKKQPESGKSENENQTLSKQPTIQWDDSQMKSSYSNVCNVASTKEEVMLLFGMNQVWNNKQEDVVVELTNRIIMTPRAAKRLLVLLSKTLSDHEKDNDKSS
ncbi:MAG: DUF3467 domain-containing protein [Magnetococcales bacterium]|nr:DUF3467 domain-containing protein [Magnetococcales bacterium]